MINATPDARDYETDYVMAVDLHLTALVEFTNQAIKVDSEHGWLVGITLQMAGGVVTGHLTSHDVWVARMKESFEGAGAKGLGALFDPPAEPADEDGGVQPDGASEADMRLPRHIHLVDAQYVLGDGLMPTEGGMLWRGRLQDVVGWSLGQFNKNPR